MSSSKSNSRKNIVIVGGGGAGQLLALTLSQKLNLATHNIILIDPRPFRIFLPAALRLVTSDIDNLQETALIPSDHSFADGKGTFVQGKVQAIHKNAGKGGRVTLESGESVEFEYLVLATGSHWTGPVDFPDNAADVYSFIAQVRQKVKESKRIVLVGGGSVGIEFAGEIKDIYPGTEVTIVHSGDHLLSDVYPMKFRLDVEQRLQRRGIKLVLGEYVDEIPSGDYSSVHTRSGKTLSADAVFQTRGIRPNTEWIRNLGADVLTLEGFVKVKPTLQLLKYDHIFAVGDILDIKEEKQLAKINNHVPVIVANILSLISGQADKLKTYKGSSEMILVTIGKNGGAAYLGVLWGILLGDFTARMMKSKDLMIPIARKTFKY